MKDNTGDEQREEEERKMGWKETAELRRKTWGNDLKCVSTARASGITRSTMVLKHEDMRKRRSDTEL